MLFLFCHTRVKGMKCKSEVYVLCIFALTLERNRSLLLSTEQFFKVSVYILLLINELWKLLTNEL